jgi:cell division septation protein DedD
MRIFLAFIVSLLIAASVFVAGTGVVSLRACPSLGSCGAAAAGPAVNLIHYHEMPLVPIQQFEGGSRRSDEAAQWETLDGDSAFTALTLAASRTSDRDLASRALERAGFIAYVKGDFKRAELLFSEAAGKGLPDALLWQGLALLADDRIDDAAKILKKAMGSASDSTAAAAAAVGLAACDLAAGRAQEGAARCMDVLQAGGDGSAAASLVLRRCLLQLGEAGRSEAVFESLADRYPLAYEAAVIRGANEPAPEETSAQSEIPEEELTQENESPVDEGEEAAAQQAPGGGEAPLSTGGFAVQVGAFEQIGNAETLAARLVDEGYDSVRVESESRQGIVLHCVRVGAFANKEDAASLASILNEKDGLSTTIVNTNLRSPASQTEER